MARGCRARAAPWRRRPRCARRPPRRGRRPPRRPAGSRPGCWPGPGAATGRQPASCAYSIAAPSSSPAATGRRAPRGCRPARRAARTISASTPLARGDSQHGRSVAPGSRRGGRARAAPRAARPPPRAREARVVGLAPSAAGPLDRGQRLVGPAQRQVGLGQPQQGRRPGAPVTSSATSRSVAASHHAAGPRRPGRPRTARRRAGPAPVPPDLVAGLGEQRSAVRQTVSASARSPRVATSTACRSARRARWRGSGRRRRSARRRPA